MMSSGTGGLPTSASVSSSTACNSASCRTSFGESPRCGASARKLAMMSAAARIAASLAAHAFDVPLDLRDLRLGQLFAVLGAEVGPGFWQALGDLASRHSVEPFRVNAENFSESGEP